MSQLVSFGQAHQKGSFATHLGAQTPRDVYYLLLDRLPEEPSIAILAYAIFERERYRWLEAKEQETGTSVDPARQSDWVAAYDLQQAEQAAREALDISTRLDAITSAMGSVQTELSRIPPATKDFWIGFGSNLASSFVFIALILLCAAVFELDPSPFKMLKEFFHLHH